ncbi:MAG TPA: TonB family protein [Acidobacteriaceae bacterium]|jgi:protein TonB|nr:TonB family protein [Acidobacteriaceae bacterium]
MADLNVLPPEIDPHTPAPVVRPPGETLHLSGEIKEEGVFQSLISNIRDAFFAPKLPPLVLESRPIAVPDRMKSKRSPTSTAWAVGAHAAIILLVALLIMNHVKIAAPVKEELTAINVPPPMAPLVKHEEKIGGGGGQHDLAPVTKGRLPKLATQQIVPPKAPPTIPPKLAVEPTVVVQPNLKLATNTMPNLGMPNSSLNGVSLGNGNGGGIGSGNGNGIGPGSGGNIGGGVMHVGGSVSPPEVIYQVDPEFSEEARKAKFSGNVEVYLIVGQDGRPRGVRVVRGVGMGLDEKAVQAVQQYRFKPAMQNGKPVSVDLYIDVNFQIF